MTENRAAPPPFVTFYSFKGGVGRTMALANVACILAGRGRRVLCIDLDLEAPGLTYLAVRERGQVARTPGFVDLISDLLKKGTAAPIADKSNPLAFLEYTHELPIPKHAIRGEGGKLRLMPAGRMDEQYEDRLRDIDLGRLYGEGKGKPILKHLRNIIANSDQFDYVLIDSRTGFSEEAGICVRDLSDHLVILFGLNRQNVAGTGRFLKRLRQQRIEPSGIIMAASPIPLGEDELRNQRLDHAKNEFRDAWGENAEVNLQIPYHPRLALDEEPFIFQWADTELYSAYSRLEEAVRVFADDTAQSWMDKAQKAISDGKHDQAIERLNELLKLERKLALLVMRTVAQNNLGKQKFDKYFEILAAEDGKNADIAILYGRHLIKRGDYQGAFSKLSECLKIYDALGSAGKGDSASVKRIMADVHRYKGEYIEAMTLYKESLEVFKELGDLSNVAIVNCAIASINTQQGRHNEALVLYKESLNTFEKNGDRRNATASKASIADIHIFEGRYDEALALYKESLNVSEEIGDRANAAISMGSIAHVNKLRGRYDKALALYKESLNTFEEIGERVNAAVSKDNIAEINKLRGRYDKALALYKESLNTFEEIGERANAAASKGNIAEVHRLQGRYNDALTMFKENIKVVEDIGDCHGQAILNSQIGIIFGLSKRESEAFELLNKAIKSLTKLGDPYEIARAYINEARVAIHVNNYDLARKALTKSRRLATKIDSKHLLADIAVLSSKIEKDPSSVDRRAIQDALDYYRSQDIQTDESKEAVKMLRRLEQSPSSK